MPHPEKSSRLRVATGRFRDLAIAAISPSQPSKRRPARSRATITSPYASAAAASKSKTRLAKPRDRSALNLASSSRRRLPKDRRANPCLISARLIDVVASSRRDWVRDHSRTLRAGRGRMNSEITSVSRMIMRIKTSVALEPLPAQEAQARRRARAQKAPRRDRQGFAASADPTPLAECNAPPLPSNARAQPREFANAFLADPRCSVS